MCLNLGWGGQREANQSASALQEVSSHFLSYKGAVWTTHALEQGGNCMYHLL
jgi:hypothetical protein